MKDTDNDGIPGMKSERLEKALLLKIDDEDMDDDNDGIPGRTIT